MNRLVNGINTYMLYFRIIAVLLLSLWGIPVLFSSAAHANAEALPVLLKADTVRYHKNKSIVMAVGNVEVTQGGRILISDKLIYNKAKNTVYAVGNVTLREPTGDIFFAKMVQLKDSMKQGIINRFSVRFKDNSLLVANQAIRKNVDIVTLEKAAYSPCPICKENGKTQWQLKAKKATIDDEKQRVSYQDARLEVYGVPVLYTPYLSHASPDADRKSGLLMPTYGTSGTLGTRIELPFYVNIASNMDTTLTPIITSKEGLVIANEFRHKIPQGEYELSGSYTRTERFDNQGGRLSSKESRGHIEGKGTFTLPHDWQVGFIGKHASDDTYLRRYKWSDEDYLTTRLFAQQFNNRNYTTAEMLYFQGLRAEDNSETTPFIFPLIHHHRDYDANFHGARWTLDINTMGLTRDTGAQSRRISSTLGWSIPYISPTGHVMKLSTSLRGDLYAIEDFFTANDPTREVKGLEHRLIPELQLDWQFPMVRYLASNQIFVEPVLNIIVSPNGNNPDGIPNEDSQALEISDDNIFSSNRFTGFDRVETGLRMNYGIRGGMRHANGHHVNAILGQNYRAKENNNFGIDSGLDDNFSDYVGRLEYRYRNTMSASYRFRFDAENLSSHRHEIASSLHLSPVTLNLHYLLLDEEDSSASNDREEIATSAAIKLSDHWSIDANGRIDLTKDGGLIHTGANLFYHGDCTYLGFSWLRDSTGTRDIEPNTSFTFRVGLKNLN